MFSFEIRPLGHFFLFTFRTLNRHDECTLARRNLPAYLIRSTLLL